MSDVPTGVAYICEGIAWEPWAPDEVHKVESTVVHVPMSIHRARKRYPHKLDEWLGNFLMNTVGKGAACQFSFRRKPLVEPRQLVCDTINHILKNPKLLNQDRWYWSSGPAFCFLGHAEVLGMGRSRPLKSTSWSDIRDLLGMGEILATWSAYKGRTLDELYLLCREHLAGRVTILRNTGDPAADISPRFAKILAKEKMPEGGWPLLNLKDFPCPEDRKKRKR